MKKLLPITLLLMVPVFLYGQQDLCCTLSAPEEFAALSQNMDFAMLHEIPQPYIHQSKQGDMITFPTKDGKTGNAFFLKASGESYNYLFVIHEWWGLNDHIKKEAERFYNELGNVNVMAIDLYDGNVASTREDAMKYIRQVTNERADAIISGAVDYSGSNSKIATIGWCFGGGWSLQSALIAGSHSVGCVMYYGRPEQDVEKLKTLNSDVLGIFAVHDSGIGPDVVAKFQNDMVEAGKSITVHSFDAEHAFANPSSPRYNSNAAQMANQLALAYLKGKFNQ